MPYAGLDLTGRKALVTGAGRGIGATLAVGLAQAGADVAVCDLGSDESWEGLADTVWKIRNEGQVGLAVDMDVQEVSEIRPVIRQLADDLGGPGHPGEQRGHPATGAGAGGDGGGLGRGDGHQFKGSVFLRAGGGAADDSAGVWSDHQHSVADGFGGIGEPGGVLRKQGRAAEPDAGAGVGMGTARDNGERHRARADADAGGDWRRRRGTLTRWRRSCW